MKKLLMPSQDYSLCECMTSQQAFEFFESSLNEAAAATGIELPEIAAGQQYITRLFTEWAHGRSYEKLMSPRLFLRDKSEDEMIDLISRGVHPNVIRFANGVFFYEVFSQAKRDRRFLRGLARGAYRGIANRYAVATGPVSELSQMCTHFDAYVEIARGARREWLSEASRRRLSVFGIDLSRGPGIDVTNGGIILKFKSDGPQYMN